VLAREVDRRGDEQPRRSASAVIWFDEEMDDERRSGLELANANAADCLGRARRDKCRIRSVIRPLEILGARDRTVPQARRQFGLVLGEEVVQLRKAETVFGPVNLEHTCRFASAHAKPLSGRAARASRQVLETQAEEGAMPVDLSKSLARACGTFVAAALLAACGAPTADVLSADGVQSVAHRSARDARTWMAPEAYGENLVYAGGDAQSYVFSFPTGKLVGNIAGTSFGTCADSQGDVFFSRVRSVVEFAHAGTTPIALYSVPGTAYSCSIDPTTGDIAVVVFCLSGCGDEIALFKAGDTEPVQTYSDPALTSMSYCGYDNDGNLFVDGYNGSQFRLAELPVGGSTFTTITLKQSVPFAGQVQWDGHYMTLELPLHPVIYRLQIAGSRGSVVGTTRLDGVGLKAGQSWIHGSRVIVPTGPFTKRPIEIITWQYPAGGKPSHTWDGFIGPNHQQLDGVTFSLAKK
jgi:hypothetical protein